MAEDDGNFGIEYSEVDKAYMAKGGAELQLAAPPVAAGAGDGFMIDPYPAQQCIEWMTRIAEDVRLAAAMGGSLRFDPPGSDEVSVNLSRNAHTMATQAEMFVETWARQIEAARDGLRAQFDAYQEVEADNASRLT